MFLAGMSGHLKANARAAGWRDGARRPLREAAAMASQLVENEHLAIGAGPSRDTTWYATSLMAGFPVYGRHGESADFAAIDDEARKSLDLDATAEHLGTGENGWHDLEVTREDFARYVDWLRSVW